MSRPYAQGSPPGALGLREVFRQSTDRRGWIFVAAAAVLMGVAALVEANSVYATDDVLWGWLALSIVWVMAACLLAYPFPLLGLGVAAALSAANILLPPMPHGGGTQLLTTLFLVGFLAFRLPGRWSVGAWLVGAGVPAAAIVFQTGDWWEVMFYLMFVFPAWFVGVLLQRERRRSAELTQLAAELAAEREHRTEAALLAERTRIARELHDAVAHSVSVMTLQVGVVRRRLAALPTEQDTLRQAELLGRQSVDELRRIVGLVRPDGPELAPVPSLRQLDALIEQVRATGTPVVLRCEGSLDDLGPALDVCAYRIVQEALTNALKHAPGTGIRLAVRRQDQQLIIEVHNGGPRWRGEVRVGNGLIGMAERVGMLGGRLRYGAGENDGFMITVVLPVNSPVRIQEPVG